MAITLLHELGIGRILLRPPLFPLVAVVAELVGVPVGYEAIPARNALTGVRIAVEKVGLAWGVHELRGL